jgi:hypothetical protein
VELSPTYRLLWQCRTKSKIWIDVLDLVPEFGIGILLEGKNVFILKQCRELLTTQGS